MGRPSPTQKKAKRQRQKVRRKLVFASKPVTQKTASNSASFGEQSEPEETHEVDSDDMHMGDINTDVVEMVVYDDYRQIDSEPYPPPYLRAGRNL